MTNMTTTTCVRGCTIAGQHATECAGGECRGCLPRPTEVGALCWWCIKRLRETLAEIPALVTWLREAGEPLARFGQTSDVKGRGDTAETVPMHAAWLEADELDAEVASWALALVEEHPVRMVGHKALGLHPAEWLDRHHETLATMGFAEEIVRALTRAVATLKARFPPPWAVEPERQVPIPCPRCGAMLLTYTPQAWAFQPFRVSCGNPDCGRVFSEDEWDKIKSLAAAGARRWVS